MLCAPVPGVLVALHRLFCSNRAGDRKGKTDASHVRRHNRRVEFYFKYLTASALVLCLVLLLSYYSVGFRSWRPLYGMTTVSAAQKRRVLLITAAKHPYAVGSGACPSHRLPWQPHACRPTLARPLSLRCKQLHLRWQTHTGGCLQH